MIVDSSAVLAILLQESDAFAYSRALEQDSRRLMSVVNWMEVAVIVDSRNVMPAGPYLDRFMQASGIEICPATLEHAQLARQAYSLFGKGRHPAGLNFGDCFAYALAMATGQPLLFKGDDFARTDVMSALA